MPYFPSLTPDELMIWVLLGSTFTIGPLLFLLMKKAVRFNSENFPPYMVAAFVIPMGLSALFYCSSYTTIPAQTVVIDSGDQIVRVFQDSERLWNSHSLFDNPDYQFVSYTQKKLSVAMTARPITPNPKVRRLAYTVSLTALGNPENYLRYRQEILGPFNPKVLPQLTIHHVSDADASAFLWLEKQLYDLNEHRSKELARFFNPLEDSQQAEFSELVSEFLAPRCEKAGVQFASAHFELSD